MAKFVAPPPITFPSLWRAQSWCAVEVVFHAHAMAARPTPPGPPVTRGARNGAPLRLLIVRNQITRFAIVFSVQSSPTFHRHRLTTSPESTRRHLDEKDKWRLCIAAIIVFLIILCPECTPRSHSLTKSSHPDFEIQAISERFQPGLPALPSQCWRCDHACSHGKGWYDPLTGAEVVSDSTASMLIPRPER